jgi:hypothetical protein
MAACHPTSPSLEPKATAAMGHEGQFPAPRPSARYRIDQETFAGTPGNERDAPIPDLAPAPEQRGSSHNGHSELRQRIVGRQKAVVRTGLLHALTTRSRQLVE